MMEGSYVWINVRAKIRRGIVRIADIGTSCGAANRTRFPSQSSSIAAGGDKTVSIVTRCLFPFCRRASNPASPKRSSFQQHAGCCPPHQWQCRRASTSSSS
eukprot:TRINITY_DN475_c1_g2_i2.p1 TRINITY_DN475_c1_g2~~TRINITY_DN475_c1_g2_i2.p1  ORF type:complete len:101 (+),score=9.93 TRINITY_DN475_c1_g2_i2:1271-1573(+)